MKTEMFSQSQFSDTLVFLHGNKTKLSKLFCYFIDVQIKKVTVVKLSNQRFKL